jgi:hypothetical protein
MAHPRTPIEGPAQPLPKADGGIDFGRVAVYTTQSGVGQQPTIGDTVSVVEEVPNSPGQLLDERTRTLTERRFGHHFSQIRVNRIGTPQAELAVNRPGDAYEQEADRVADSVMRNSEATNGPPSDFTRGHAPTESMASVPPATDIFLRSDQTIQASSHFTQARPDLENRLNSSKGQGKPLSNGVRSFFEPRFGRDFSDVRVHTGSDAVQLNREVDAEAFTFGKDIYFGAGQFPGKTGLTAHELTHVVQQTGVDSVPRDLRLIQRQVAKTATFVPYQIYVKEKMTAEEFKAAAMRQIFGGIPKNVKWEHAESVYVPEKSPYTVQVDTELLKQQRGQASRERGIGVDAGGGVVGAEERAKAFASGPKSDEKTALLDEIDRRYFEAIGDKTKTKIRAGEKGKADLWRMIRDEVLFQHEYITNLPPDVKDLLKSSTQGKDMTPADYERLFAIAKKIAKMPPGQLSDYASKVTDAPTDLVELDASLDKYIAEMAKRNQQSEERKTVQNKLVGLEEVYKKYRLYKTLLTSGSMGAALSGVNPQGGGAGLVTVRESEKLRKEIDTEVQAYKFTGIDDFESYISRFEQAFEQEAANISLNILEKYAGRLYRESERYKNPAEVAALYQALGGVRASYQEFEVNAKIWNDYVRARNKASEQSRIPGQGHLTTDYYTSTTLSEAEEARKKAEAAKASAQQQLAGISSDHPIFQEGDLPLDRRIDKAALAKASESELAAVLQGHIHNRMTAIGEARAEIEGKSELIYRMDAKTMARFYAQQGIKADSIHDMIIQDKIHSDAIVKLVIGIGVAMVAIALAVVTAGAATPALLAAGTALAGAGLGAYQAYEAYVEYTEQEKLADVGLATDPSMVWLVIAVVGAGIDLAVAAKAVKALGPAAKALNAGGDLAEFTKAVRALEKENEIEAKVARAAERAGAAREGFKEATADLGKALGKAYSIPGPFTDPEVYKALVKMAREAIKTKFYDLQKFIDELMLARVRKGLAGLAPEELVKAKQAWEEAQGLEAAEAAIESAEKAQVGSYNTKIKWGIQTVDARPHTSIKGAFWGRRTPQANVRVNAYELKINPNNESFYLPHPSGGYVQFEGLLGTELVQDGKLIMQQRSIYHVADMPSFAAQQVLNEARRQVAAASAAGMRVEWLVSESRAMQQLDALFKKEGIAITLSLLPE